MAFDATAPAYQAQILSQPLRDNFVAIKTQLDLEHNENGTHKDQLKRSGDVSTGDQAVKKSIPALRMIGTEVDAKDLRIVEDAGVLKIQKNMGTELVPIWSDSFALNLSTNRLSTVKITEANLDSTTQIPDSRLAQITTVGKIAESALPTTLPKLNTQNTFTVPQTIQGTNAALYLNNSTDSVYQAVLKKDSDTTAKLSIQNKSDGSDVAVYSFAADGNLTTKKLTAQTQLVSQVGTGTPPLVVSSSTLVNNLNAQYWGGEAKPTYFTGSTYPTFQQYVSRTDTLVPASYSNWTAYFNANYQLPVGSARYDGAYTALSASLSAKYSEYESKIQAYAESRLYNEIIPQFGAGTYTIQSVLQNLINSAHTHRAMAWMRAWNCDCNCNCQCCTD